ncbi:MAG: hypothetical protein IT355_15215 [Gemmatimonadaceae bacterium]|nr:hypothetical protein [Gemmatimonadaceae bacterium]
MPRKSLSVLLLLGALSGCHEPIGPVVPSGLFVLERVSGESVPVLAYVDATYRYIRVADSLVVRGDGNGEQATVQRVERIDGTSTPNTVTWRVPIRFDRANGTIRFGRGCPINASCAVADPVPVTISAGGLAFTIDGGRHEYRSAAPAP